MRYDETITIEINKKCGILRKSQFYCGIRYDVTYKNNLERYEFYCGDNYCNGHKV